MSVCSVDACGRPVKAKGVCAAHYQRLWRCGSPLGNQVKGRKWIAEGYELQFLPGHPISQPSGQIATHRLILYAKIGPGEHNCAGCGDLVSWEKGTLKVNHVDENKLNNDPENLEPVCFECNCLHSAILRQRRRRYKFGYYGKSSRLSDKCFDLFLVQWTRKDSIFRLNETTVREQIMSVIGTALGFLAVAEPKTAQNFMELCTQLANNLMPSEIQEKIKCVVGRG